MGRTGHGKLFQAWEELEAALDAIHGGLRGRLIPLALGEEVDGKIQFEMQGLDVVDERCFADFLELVWIAGCQGESEGVADKG